MTSPQNNPVDAQASVRPVARNTLQGNGEIVEVDSYNGTKETIEADALQPPSKNKYVKLVVALVCD